MTDRQDGNFINMTQKNIQWHFNDGRSWVCPTVLRYEAIVEVFKLQFLECPLEAGGPMKTQVERNACC